jgi:hypothetical protein
MDKTRLKHLIKEVYQKKDSCNCGCHSCDNVGNPGVVLNESLVKKDILSENLRYHVDKQLPLTENTFRYGSESFLNLWAEARSLYLREIIHVNEDDKEILEETNLGDFGLYEGVKVPLDLLMMEEEELKEISPITVTHIAASAASTAARGISSSEGGGESNPWVLLAIGVLMTLPVAGLAISQSGLGEKVINWVKYYKLNRVIDRLRKDPEVLEYIKDKKPGIQNFLKSKLTDKEQKYIKQISWNKITKGEIYEINNFLEEAEDKKKNPPLGKPKRGGSKKFYVYVKNPKTKKIKKISFGDTTGLSAKINNPKARQAFAARHDCKNKTDKTKASYWSCRLPRYAKLLGLKSSFSGFW